MSTNKAEQVVAYAALILADESITITPEKLQTLIKAAGIEDIEPIWTTIFAKALEGKDVKGILTKVGAAGPTTSGPQVGDDKADRVADDGKAGQEVEVCESSEDEDLGLSLFD